MLTLSIPQSNISHIYWAMYESVYGKQRNVGLSGSNQKTSQIPNGSLETEPADQMSSTHNCLMSAVYYFVSNCVFSRKTYVEIGPRLISEVICVQSNCAR